MQKQLGNLFDGILLLHNSQYIGKPEYIMTIEMTCGGRIVLHVISISKFQDINLMNMPNLQSLKK